MTVNHSVHLGPDYDYALLSLIGDIDLDTVSPIKAAAIDLCERSPSTRIGFDLSHVTFMDSSGLSLIALATRELRQRADVRLAVIAASNNIQRLLSLTGMDTVLDLHPDLPTWLAASSASVAAHAPESLPPRSVGKEMVSDEV